MIDRIADNAHNTRLTGYLQSTQTRMRETQLSISTGKSAQRFADIADQARLLTATRHESRVLEERLVQDRIGVDRLTAMSGALEGVGNVVERLRALTVQRLSGAAGKEVPLASEIDSMLQEIAGRLNVSLDGRHLFAGSRTGTAPIDMPASVSSAADLANVFVGDTQHLAIRIDDGATLEVPLTADDFVPLLETMADLKAAHQAGDVQALQTGLAALTGHVAEVAAHRGTLGVETARLESITEGHAAELDYLTQVVSRIEDTDLPSAMTRLAQDRTTLEAAYATIAQLGRLSLADYLR
ncbi:MAG: hypothetical protein KDE35_01175 [Geminicoccaceae bacterium]|nr:hypothetical protein [Geminicoccaceae bacterium]